MNKTQYSIKQIGKFDLFDDNFLSNSNNLKNSLLLNHLDGKWLVICTSKSRIIAMIDKELENKFTNVHDYMIEKNVKNYFMANSSEHDKVLILNIKTLDNNWELMVDVFKYFNAVLILPVANGEIIGQLDLILKDWNRKVKTKTIFDWRNYGIRNLYFFMNEGVLSKIDWPPSGRRLSDSGPTT